MAPETRCVVGSGREWTTAKEKYGEFPDCAHVCHSECVSQSQRVLVFCSLYAQQHRGQVCLSLLLFCKEVQLRNVSDVDLAD